MVINDVIMFAEYEIRPAGTGGMPFPWVWSAGEAEEEGGKSTCAA